MSKKVKSILIGGVVLLVLVGALLALMLIPQEEANDENAILDGKELTTLVKESADDLQSIKVTNTLGEYTLSRLEDESFGIVELEGLPQLASAISNAKSGSASISANRTVEENCTNLSQYGLAEPQMRLQLEFTNGNKYDLSLGAITADGIYRYCIVTGEDTVYAVSKRGMEIYDIGIYDYLETTILAEYGADGETFPDIRELRIERSDWEKPFVIEEMSEDKPIITTDPLIITSPAISMINTTKLEDYIYSIFGLTATDVVGINPTEEELAEYGLNDPEATLQMVYDEERTEVAFRLGKALDSEGNPVTGSKTPAAYYLMKEGTDIVYVVSVNDLPWMTMTQGTLVSTILTLPYLTNVGSIHLQLGGENYAINVKQLESETSDEESTANIPLEISINGTVVAEAEARRLYQLLLNSSVQGYISDEKAMEILLKSSNAHMNVAINLLDGTVETLSYWQEEDLNLIVGYNGTPAYTGRSGYIDKVAKELQNLLDGNAVDINW